MCGIFGVVNDQTNKAPQTVLEGLKKLEYRGYDSWGIATISDVRSEIEVEKHIGKIGAATTSLPEGRIAIGHTRWATHGGVTDQNAHPHLDCHKKIAVIHNGIVENYQDLKIKLGPTHHFLSETDTEVIAHLIEEEMKTQDIVQATLSVFKMLSGSNAICVLDTKTRCIISCRNGSPMAIGIGDKQYFIASDVTPFLKFTQNVYFLNDGEAVVLGEQKAELYDIESQKKKEYTTQKLDWKIEDAEKGGFPHFLIKEIMEQKVTIPKTASLNEDAIVSLSQKMKEGYRIVLIGCGTAYYCALAAQYFFAQSGIKASVYGAYEFLPFSSFCDDKTVFFAISQSGETADTLIATKAAKQRGAHIVSVINARGSTLERLADTVLAVGAGPEIAVVSTKAFTSQLSTLYLVSQAMSGNYEVAKKQLKNVGAVLSEWLSETFQAQMMMHAKELIDKEDMYMIGKYFNYPAALEFSLKIKETSYIHSEAFASGELKHGVITLIQKGTPCFVLASNDEVKQEVLSSAAELRARGAQIFGVAPFSSPEFDTHIQTPDLGDLTLIGNIIAGQLLGYYLGIGRGADPDKPRNLAKSVTVK